MKKKILSCILALALLPAGGYARAAERDPFSDVPTGAWFAPYVDNLVRRGVVNGFEDGTFRPQAEVTIGQALKLIVLSGGFTDILNKGEHWAGGYLSFAQSRRYITGDNYDLDAPVTRLQVAKLCAAVLELDPAMAEDERVFADTTDPSVLALHHVGILTGSEEGGRLLFRGDQYLTRAEVCAILDRMLPYVDAHFTKVSGIRAPIDYRLRFQSYDSGAFYLDAKERICTREAGLTPRCGIDVSYYQHEIDWEKVAEDGIDFAIIRCGYRGSTQGVLCEDECFRQNIAGALAAGVNVGIYFFSQALTEAEALEEADYVLSLIEGCDVTYPVVFDWERLTSESSRTKDPDWDAVSDCAVAFCERIAAAGYRPMTYFNRYSAYLQWDMTKLQRYDGWLASYNSTPNYLYDFQMWQYSSKGKVDGIDTHVDMDLCLVPYDTI
ncbi:MAG: S-layer homology domain-containing protein [Oscillospiraceae bacterium]|nr:S-layer homology domain-containing protein [Oscillospiraceae bacterium]